MFPNSIRSLISLRCIIWQYARSRISFLLSFLLNLGGNTSEILVIQWLILSFLFLSELLCNFRPIDDFIGLERKDGISFGQCTPIHWQRTYRGFSLWISILSGGSLLWSSPCLSTFSVNIVVQLIDAHNSVSFELNDSRSQSLTFTLHRVETHDHEAIHFQLISFGYKLWK